MNLPQQFRLDVAPIRDAIVAVWVPPVVLDNGHVFHTLGGAGGLVANLRSQILAGGLSAIVKFCRGIRTAAARVDGDVHEVDQEEFRAAASHAGAALTVRIHFFSAIEEPNRLERCQKQHTREGVHASSPLVSGALFDVGTVFPLTQASEMTQAFRHLDRRGIGKVPVVDALRAVRGEVSTRRARAIDDAFDSVLFEHGDGGGQNGETLEPTTVAKLFRAEAHPDVVSGARSQGEVWSEFLEAFEGKSEFAVGCLF